ncbi:MAG: NAD-dependent epimerase/dehydratase family protein [Clostridia bacterium]|nr:NAD-dependent epimerase/dehydratase family protein [Clostridia bacterium]
MGPRNNIKVTTPTDYYLIQALYKYKQDEYKSENELNKIIEEDINHILDNPINFKKLENSTVLITGASGMIGTYLLYTLAILNDLRSLNIKIVALVRDRNKITGYLKNRDDLIVLEQDVCDRINYDDKVDYIIHAASPASPKIMKDAPVDTLMANTLGTYNTLKLAKKSNTKSYVFISSREVYGEPYEWQEEFKEDTYGFIDPLLPRSCYPEGKRAAENMCVTFKEQYGVNAKIVRPAHTYGPGMSIYDGRVQADFLKNVVEHQNILMKSTGEALRTYTYIRDVVAGIFFVLLEAEDIAYNVADEEAKITIKGLAELLVGLYPERKLKVEMKIEENQKGVAPFKLGTINSEKIRALGWKPTITIEEGFRRTVEYIESTQGK